MKDKCQRFVGRNNVKSSDRTPRPTITTRQRIEQAVEQFAERERYCVGSDILYREDVVKFVLAERRRIYRQVKNVQRHRMGTYVMLNANADNGIWVDINDILARLRG